MSESKIVFSDGRETRVIRGIIEEEDQFFVTLARRDGTVRIAKQCIQKIEEWNRSDVCEFSNT